MMVVIPIILGSLFFFWSNVRINVTSMFLISNSKLNGVHSKVLQSLLLLFQLYKLYRCMVCCMIPQLCMFCVSGRAVEDQTCSHHPRKGMTSWRMGNWAVEGRYPSNKATCTRGVARHLTRTGRRNMSRSVTMGASHTIQVCTWVSP